MAKRNAIVVAVTLEVQCPHCGEPQPSPDNGAHSWMPSQVQTAQGTRTCVSCEEPFELHAQGRVIVEGS
jgi:DNA-directed RNA polymerase subunit RPC12/RpoP